MNNLADTHIEAESVRAEIASLKVNDEQLAARVRHLEKMLDTLGTPLWKRILFRLDGWPPWYIVSESSQPASRPWRKWYRS
jgi:hypothetical protein